SHSCLQAPPVVAFTLSLHDALPIYDDELDAGVGLLRLSDVRVHLRRHELAGQRSSGNEVAGEVDPEPCAELPSVRDRAPNALEADRKSTRLNSSHVKISYAVFCLKK